MALKGDLESHQKNGRCVDLFLHINIHSKLGDACLVREFINLGAAQREKARCVE